MTDSAAIRTEIKRAMSEQETLHRLQMYAAKPDTLDKIRHLDEPHRLELRAHYRECQRRLKEVMPPV